MSETPLLAAPAGWPAAAAAPAWAGTAGMIAQTIAPHTEADPVAILAQTLAGAGAVVGRGAWLEIEATRHHPNEFVVGPGPQRVLLGPRRTCARPRRPDLGRADPDRAVHR